MENNSININWKYIVYQTTNLVNNKIYIGVHKTQNPEVFDGYLGNGIYVSQPYTYQYAKTAFQYAVKKYGPENFKRTILAIFDTSYEAYDLEEQIVNDQFLKRNDVYNMILGGINGYFVSKRCQVSKYTLDGNYVGTYNSMIDAATDLNVDYSSISHAIRKKTVSCGYLWSTDKTDKLDPSNYDIKIIPSKSIFVYSVKGKYITEFNSQSEASKYYNLSSTSIREACLLGNCVRNSLYFCYIKKDTYDAARTEYIKQRPVYQYCGKTGKFIKEFENQLQAEKLCKCNISKALRLKKPDEHGFIWGLEKLDMYNTPKFNKPKLVGKFDQQDNIIEIYESATKAAKINGTSVWKVLSGTNLTHKGHIYRYLQS